MGDVEVQFGPAPARALKTLRPSELAQQDLFVARDIDSSLPEDIETDDAREMRAMVKAHDYWQRKPSAAQANPFEDS